MEMTRKEMLKLGLLGRAALFLPLQRAAQTAGVEPLRRLPRPFQAELPVPRQLRPTSASATTDFYEITAKEAAADILPGLQTEVWGYDGSFPGPLIKARRGREVVVRHSNGLSVDTSVHLHGAHVDGDETDLILGMHAIGPRVTEIIHEGAFAELVEGTPQEMAMAVHAHPTLSEALGETAMDVDGHAINF